MKQTLPHPAMTKTVPQTCNGTAWGGFIIRGGWVIRGGGYANESPNTDPVIFLHVWSAVYAAGRGFRVLAVFRLLFRKQARMQGPYSTFCYTHA